MDYPIERAHASGASSMNLPPIDEISGSSGRKKAAGSVFMDKLHAARRKIAESKVDHLPALSREEQSSTYGSSATGWADANISSRSHAALRAESHPHAHHDARSVHVDDPPIFEHHRMPSHARGLGGTHPRVPSNLAHMSRLSSSDSALHDLDTDDRVSARRSERMGSVVRNSVIARGPDAETMRRANLKLLNERMVLLEFMSQLQQRDLLRPAALPMVQALLSRFDYKPQGNNLQAPQS
eukprot:m.73359 g.73359  ORF g.73359 m.73359 type:complete len:240 (+) comp7718_c0_seq2:1337-2056(+)